MLLLRRFGVYRARRTPGGHQNAHDIPRPSHPDLQKHLRNPGGGSKRLSNGGGVTNSRNVLIVKGLNVINPYDPPMKVCLGSDLVPSKTGRVALAVRCVPR